MRPSSSIITENVPKVIDYHDPNGYMFLKNSILCPALDEDEWMDTDGCCLMDDLILKSATEKLQK